MTAVPRIPVETECCDNRLTTYETYETYEKKRKLLLNNIDAEKGSTWGRIIQNKFDKDKNKIAFDFDYERGTDIRPPRTSNSTKKHHQKEIHVPQDIWTSIFSFVNINIKYRENTNYCLCISPSIYGWHGFHYNVPQNKHHSLATVCKTFLAALVISLTRHPHRERITDLAWHNSLTQDSVSLDQNLKNRLIRIVAGFNDNFFYFTNLYTKLAQLSSFKLISNAYYNERQIWEIITKQKEKFSRVQKLEITNFSLQGLNPKKIKETFPNVKKLHIRSTNEKPQIILAHKTGNLVFEKLESLTVNIQCKNSISKFILPTKLDNLKKLNIWDFTSLKQKNVQNILDIQMPKLECLHMMVKSEVSNIIIAGMNNPSTQNLKRLHFENIKTKSILTIDHKIAYIFRNLTYLLLKVGSIKINKNTDCELKHLKYLYINTFFYNDEDDLKISSEYQVALPEAPNLETLHVESAHITQINAYPKLKNLKLYNVNGSIDIKSDFLKNLNSIEKITLYSLCTDMNKNNYLNFHGAYDGFKNKKNLDFYTKIINGCTVDKIKTLSIIITHNPIDQKKVDQYFRGNQKLTDCFSKHEDSVNFEKLINTTFLKHSREIKTEDKCDEPVVTIYNNINNEQIRYENQLLCYTEMTL